MLEEGERGAKGHPGSEAGRPVGEEGEWPRFHGNRLGHIWEFALLPTAQMLLLVAVGSIGGVAGLQTPEEV